MRRKIVIDYDWWCFSYENDHVIHPDLKTLLFALDRTSDHEIHFDLYLFSTKGFFGPDSYDARQQVCDVFFNFFSEIQAYLPKRQITVFLEPKHFFNFYFNSSETNHFLFSNKLHDLDNPPLFVSRNAILIGAAQSKGWVIAPLCRENHFHLEDMAVFQHACANNDYDSILFSIDIDDTLLNRQESLSQNKVILNSFIISHLVQMQRLPCEKKYQLLTARYHGVALPDLKLRVNQFKRELSALFEQMMEERAELVLEYMKIVFNENFMTYLSRFSFPNNQIDSLVSPDVECHMTGLFAVKKAFRSAAPFITSLPAITTQGKCKGAYLNKLKKERQLVVHYDDDVSMIESIRKNAPHVICVQIWRKDFFRQDLFSVVAQWFDRLPLFINSVDEVEQERCRFSPR